MKQKLARAWSAFNKPAPRGGLLALLAALLLANVAYGGWQLTYNPKTSCNLCHIIQPFVESYQTSDYLDHSHFEGHVNCKDCHSSTPIDCVDEAVAYVTGNYHNPPRGAKVEKDVCLECHRSYASLAERTGALEPNPHASHLGEIECTLCHNAHAESEIYCVQCHAAGFDFQLPEAGAVSSLQ